MSEGEQMGDEAKWDGTDQRISAATLAELEERPGPFRLLVFEDEDLCGPFVCPVDLWYRFVDGAFVPAEPPGAVSR